MYIRQPRSLLFILLLATIVVISSLVPITALAQGVEPTFTPITPETGNPLAQFFTEDASLADLLNGLFRLAISIGGLLAVLQLAYGGWLYMTSELGSKKEEARERIRNALIGLLMLLATVLVLRQINPDIVSLNILEGFGAVTTQQSGAPGGGGTPGGSAPNTDGGVYMTTPSGWCYDTDPSAGTGATNRYICFNTLNVCQLVSGFSCQAYGGSAGYTPGAPSGYSKLVWIHDIGQDENGNVKRCVDVRGPGWVDLGANACGAYGSTGGQCCGLPANTSTSGTDTPTPQNANLGVFSTSELEQIPVNAWCYLFGGSEYGCYTVSDNCFNESGPAVCLKRASTTEWGNAWTPSVENPVTGKICGEIEDAIEFNDLFRYACGFATLDLCTASKIGLTNCKQY